MQFRTLAVAVIALPIAAIIGSATIVVATATPGEKADGRATDASSPMRSGEAAPAAAPRSGGNAIAIRPVVRRPMPSVGRLVPLAQADDARSFR